MFKPDCSDGKCKAGSNNKCDGKLCSDAPTSTATNEACNIFQAGCGCVTTGAGCITQQPCSDITKQVTCEGGSINKCFWNQVCLDSSCASFQNQSQCNINKANEKTCVWDAGTCRVALCSELQGSDDATCLPLSKGCLWNGTSCADATDCSKFQGLSITCESFKTSCTNPTSVTDATTPCKAKTCDDNYLTFNNDSDCNTYLEGCVTKGSGCISKASPCSSYSGNKECQKFKGENGATKCWSASESGPCANIKCALANGMTNNKSCDGFLSGCLYDGNGSCVEKIALCTDYTGDATTCLNFIGNGINKCFKGATETQKYVYCNQVKILDGTSCGYDSANASQQLKHVIYGIVQQELVVLIIQEQVHANQIAITNVMLLVHVLISLYHNQKVQLV